MIDTLQEIWATLSRSKLRTALTGVSVSTGIFLLIVLLGAGNGIINAFSGMIGAHINLDVMEVYGGVTSMAYSGFKEGRFVGLDSRDINIARHNFPRRVKEVTPVMRISVTLSHNSDSLRRTVSGAEPIICHMYKEPGHLKSGRFLNVTDLKQRRKVIVLSEKDADELFGSYKAAVGSFVNVNGIAFKVAGVYANASLSMNEDVYVPLSTAQVMSGMKSTYDVMVMRTQGIHSNEDVEQFASDFRSFAGPAHGYSPDDKNAVFMWNSTTGAEQVYKAQSILHISMWVIGLLTLISGVVGVSNIMLITVRERTHEFGIRKAIGARPRSILKTVIIESVAVTIAFGYIGMLLGVIATEYLNVVGGQEQVVIDGTAVTVFSNPTVDLATCLEALAVMVVAGVIAGLVPARKAVKVKPIEALRAE